MSTLTSVLQIGRSALRTHQIGLNVTGNNIANVNTPGYARKSANLEAKTTVMGQGLGTGVDVASLSRARDFLLDNQCRFEGGTLGRLESLERAMGAIESIFTEMAGGGATEPGAVFNQPAGVALSGAFSRFFNAFQDLANNPENQTVRASVREEAIFLTDQFHRMQAQLAGLRTDLEKEFTQMVDEVNRLTRQIANLNTRILGEKRNSTDVAGDLEDERDRLIDDLSRLVNVSVREQTNGMVTVTVTGADRALLVEGGLSSDLSMRSVVRNDAIVSDLSLASTGEPVILLSGKLKGLAEARDEKVPDFQASLDLLAETFVTRVNAIHTRGVGLDGSTGTEFFDSTRMMARDIAVSEMVLNNLNKIAASSSATGPGDGSNALALSDLRLEKMMGEGTQTLEEFYSDLIGQVGAEAREVFTDAEGQRLVMEQVETRRENVRGVSINEEAISLILSQRAYQAAARLVTVVDEMLQSTLNI